MEQGVSLPVENLSQVILRDSLASQIRADAAIGNGVTILLVTDTIFRNSLTTITVKSDLEGVDESMNIHVPIQNLS